MNNPPKSLRGKRRIPQMHTCPFCSMTFKRSQHCARHQRSRHTRERPFPCRYCQRTYARRDTAIRHEKAAHETEYSPRTVPDENIIVSAVPGNTSRYHYDPPADSRGPGPVQSEDRTALAVTEQPVSTYSPYTTSSSPNERIQQALTILDFTSLHSEALSANHLTVPHPTPLSETEFMHREITYGMDSNYTWETSESFCTYEETPSSAGSDFDEAATPPSQSSAAGQTQHCNYSRVDLTLSSGLMFDPLWDPIMSRKAAVTAYATDLHQEILRSQGFT